MKGFLSLVLAAVCGIAIAGAFSHDAGASAVTYGPPAPRVQHFTAGGFEGDLVGEWSPEAKKGWDIAVAALNAQITPKVPVGIIVKLEPLEPNILGRGGATKSAYNTPGAPLEDTWFPISLANNYAGQRLAPGPDINIWLNSLMPWDYRGEPQKALADKKPDFVTTVTHEILHGMGINGTARVVDGAGYWGDEDGEYDPETRHTLYWTGATVPEPAKITKGLFYCQAPEPKSLVTVVQTPRQPRPERGVNAGPKPSDDFRDVYDYFVVDGTGDSVLDTDLFPDPSGELNDFLTSNDLWWDGENGTKANGGKRIKLYAPSPWKPGSSYAHFDDATYDGGEDALMTSTGANLPDITVGPRLVGVLKDLGWDARPKK